LLIDKVARFTERLGEIVIRPIFSPHKSPEKAA